MACGSREMRASLRRLASTAGRVGVSTPSGAPRSRERGIRLEMSVGIVEFDADLV